MHGPRLDLPIVGNLHPGGGTAPSPGNGRAVLPPLKIGIIAHLRYPIVEPFAGGLEMHTHLLARALRGRGHAVTVFASAHSEPDLGLEAICTETALAKVGKAEAKDIGFFREHHAYLSLMSELRRRDFDVIHNNSLHYLPVTLADTLGVPMVTTLHTPPFCWLESGVRLCAGDDHAFVAVSQSVAEQWEHVTKADEVILNGIDIDKFAFHPRSDQAGYLVWYGRIVPEKGLHFAIEAARLIGLPLRIAGPILDPDYYRARIAPELGPDTLHVGHLDHTELARLVGGARAFLFTPMWDEPYGLVVAEALACGVPVAAFARGAVPEILDASCGVLAIPDDVASLAAAGREALTLDRRACRRRAERMCDAGRMVDEYEALYRKGIERAAARNMRLDVPSTVPARNPQVAARGQRHG